MAVLFGLHRAPCCVSLPIQLDQQKDWKTRNAQLRASFFSFRALAYGLPLTSALARSSSLSNTIGSPQSLGFRHGSGT